MTSATNKYERAMVGAQGLFLSAEAQDRQGAGPPAVLMLWGSLTSPQHSPLCCVCHVHMKPTHRQQKDLYVLSLLRRHAAARRGAEQGCHTQHSHVQRSRAEEVGDAQCTRGCKHRPHQDTVRQTWYMRHDIRFSPAPFGRCTCKGSPIHSTPSKRP